MNDEDRWLVLGGPEPELVRPLLAALREGPPAPEAERESFIEALMPLLARPEVPIPEAPVPEAIVSEAPPPAAPPPPPPRPLPLHAAPLPAMPPAGSALPCAPAEALPADKRASRTLQCAVTKVPFGGSKPAEVTLRLSLAMVASLCAEMAVWAHAPAEIRRRDQVPSRAVPEALTAPAATPRTPRSPATAPRPPPIPSPRSPGAARRAGR